MTRKKQDVNPDAPGILRYNSLFEILGWTVWWEYEYVGSVLTKSETHWRRIGTTEG